MGRDKSGKQEVEISAESSLNTKHFRELGERWNNIGGQNGHTVLKISRHST
jgi:hypothetical protein